MVVYIKLNLVHKGIREVIVHGCICTFVQIVATELVLRSQ